MRRNTSVIIKSNQQFNLHIEDILLWCFYFVSRHFQRLTFFITSRIFMGLGTFWILHKVRVASKGLFFFTFRGERGGQRRLIFMLNGCIIGAEKRPLTGGLISGRSRTSDGEITGITTVTMTCFANVAQRNIPWMTFNRFLPRNITSNWRKYNSIDLMNSD